MTWNWTPYTVPLVLTTALAGGVASIAWRNRDRAGATPLVILLLAIAEWALVYAFQLGTPDRGISLLLLKLQYAGIVTVPFAWLSFVLKYTGRGRYLRGRSLVLLLAIPVLTLIISWTNGVHGLMWQSIRVIRIGPLAELATQRGTWWWVHTGYSYLLLASGTFLLMQFLVVAEHVYRGQSVALLVAALTPWVGNFGYISDVVPIRVDPTPFTFLLTGVCCAAAVFRRKLLHVVPVAREVARHELIDGMVDGVLVLDEEYSIVDFNPAARSIVGADIETAVGQSVEQFLPALYESLTASDEHEEIRTEQAIEGDGATRHYDVQASPLNRGYGFVNGYLLTFRDVTDRKQRLQRLDVVHRLLRHNIRNDLNVIRGNIELVKADITADQHRKRLGVAMTTADKVIERSDKLGRVSRELDQDNRHPVELVALMESIIETHCTRSTEAQISTELPSETWVQANHTLEFAFDELVTNAIEHNENGTPTAIISIEREPSAASETTTVRITDTGPGIPSTEIELLSAKTETPLQHSSGVGLWLTAWLVRSVGGTLDFTVTDHGTTASIRLPATDRPTDSRL